MEVSSVSKVVVTPRSFAAHSDEPMQILLRNGCEVSLNPYGRIMTKSELVSMIGDADAIIVGVDPLDREVLERAERLRVISKYGVGTDNIDLRYAEERGIAVTVTPGSNTDAVADFTIALMLASARKLNEIDKACRQRNWSKRTTVDMHKQTLGLIGLGQIGKAVARRAAGFDMRILSFDRFRDEAYAAQHGIVYTESMDEVLKEADFISLHLPLTDDTRHLIGRAQFALMKETAVVVNTARGGLIDEEALFEALHTGRIWGAGIDVFEEEPPRNTSLLELDNLVIGSHCAASTVSAIDNMGILASQNLIRYL